MQSIFWDTNGTGDGAAAYTETQVQRWLRATFNRNDPANEYVLPSVGGEFAVSGAASPLAVASGFAYVNGVPAWNDASATVAVSTPASGTATRGYIVLRYDFTAQTVRVANLAGLAGADALPGLTQAAAGVFEAPLAEYRITTAGAVTLTDRRKFAHLATRVDTSMLDDLAVTAAKLASNAVSTSKIGDGQVTSAKLASGAVVAHLGYTPWGPTNDGEGSGLDADKVAGVDIAPIRRQGANAANWQAGTPFGTTPTNYSPANYRIQVGVAVLGTGLTTVTFPTAFSGTPVVTATANSAFSEWARIEGVSASNFGLRGMNPSGAASGFVVNWIAIGPA